MKRHLLFSALFMAALLLSPPAAPAKTHHNKQHVDANKKSFPTGTFYQEPTMGGTPPDEKGRMDSYEIQTKEDALVIKKMDSFSGAASMNSDTYLVYFVGTQFATHQYSCRFAGIFERRTKEKELTLVDSYKKLNCPIKIFGDKTEIWASNSGEFPSCNEFCDSQMGGGLRFGYIPLGKKAHRRHK